MKFRRVMNAAFLVFVFAFLDLTVAQQAGGVITGRVITDEGLPVSHARVSVFGVRGGMGQASVSREIVADDDGNFVVDGLEAIPYLVSAWAPGYVPASDGGLLTPFETSEARFVRVGASVTVKLIRGGVITGRVTTDAGEPVVGAPVKATRIKDETGNSSSVNIDYEHLWTRTTDDRGVYRIYGLAPGSYIVAAGGRDASSSRPTPFAGRTKTHYPSSTRDAATPVAVRSGLEARDIDIRYRGDSGFAISGKVRGATTPGMTKVLLRNVTFRETIDTTSLQVSNDQNTYAFYGVPNGEYEVIARNDSAVGENGLDSTPRRLIVNGADATGIDLVLVPNATLSGTVAVEKPGSETIECKSHRKLYPEESVVRARRHEPAKNRERLPPSPLGYGVGIPDSKGAFTIPNLKPGRHHIELELPDDTWYLKAMTMTNSKSAVDPRDGLTLRSGDQLTGLRLTVASGAAMLKGQITEAELPTPLRVYLIPFEAKAKDNLVRFVETTTQADGVFTFKNLAPGKYFVLARAMHPGARDSAERQKLRKIAETTNLTIELKPCQQITEYSVRMK
ncbi:MAG TPA: carboxypeptidase-like regulatory domain-containing protein [Pyrinomonadaceae bacterium]|nr:carboxypeptidase-like regulatory domain-containing protein [Pyrinomonadaceae bacterium]